MENLSIHINELPFIKKLVKDYYCGNEDLSHLYSYSPDIDGLKKSIKSISDKDIDTLLVKEIVRKNYSDNSELKPKEKENIEQLKNGAKCIITAHQPCLFLGPLYTITKAISAINLAEKLNESQDETIVPVFVVGGEDHDSEEILQCTVFNEKFVWETDQKGSVGNFILDDSFIEVLERFCDKLGTGENADTLKSVFRKHYHKENTISKAFAGTLRDFLGIYGLIVLDINSPALKSKMKPIWEDELSDKMALNETEKTLRYLSENYHVQATPRAYNLFEYKDGERVRIDESTPELVAKSQNFPELFSPNVTLRPMMQQKALPCVAYIGGASELAYWLELKAVFLKYDTHFPVVLLRDMIIPMGEKYWDKWNTLGLELKDFFEDIDKLKRNVALKDSSLEEDFRTLRKKTIGSFSELMPIIESIDKTLISSYHSEEAKIEKAFDILLSKSIRAEKRNSENLMNSIEKIKSKVYEDGLIERSENIASFVSRYGTDFIKKMKDSSNPLENNLKILVL